LWQAIGEKAKLKDDRRESDNDRLLERERLMVKKLKEIKL